MIFLSLYYCIKKTTTASDTTKNKHTDTSPTQILYTIAVSPSSTRLNTQKVLQRETTHNANAGDGKT